MKERKRYWCEERRVWIEEYKFLFSKVTIYKEEIFGKKTKWTFKRCKKPMHGPVNSKIEISIEEAVSRWGTNKWTWPKEPFVINGFNKYKTPADKEKEK